MGALSAADLLSVWERGTGKPPVQQGLLLLAASCPETSAEELAHLSIGQRNSRLLSLREQVFGPQLASVAACPSCNNELQLTFNAAEVRSRVGKEAGEPLPLALEGYEVQFRLPDSNDLLAIAGNEDLAVSRNLLLTRCLLAARHEGAGLPVEQLPQHIVAAVMERMAQADPQADVQLNLECPECGHTWSVGFDIVSYFWSEIQSWAQRLLHEVHLLASAYGWREADILSISPYRRQCYLNMIGGSYI
jgi:hypothetical protein